MTGYESKKAAARDKLEDDDTQVYQAWKESASDYERGFIDGMQKQMQSSVDKAVNRMAQPAQDPAFVTYKEVADTMNMLWQGKPKQVAIAGEMENMRLYTTPPQRPWVGLTEQERKEIMRYEKDFWGVSGWEWKCMEAIETKLKEKNT